MIRDKWSLIIKWAPSYFAHSIVNFKTKVHTGTIKNFNTAVPTTKMPFSFILLLSCIFFPSVGIVFPICVYMENSYLTHKVNLRGLAYVPFLWSPLVSCILLNDSPYFIKLCCGILLTCFCAQPEYEFSGVSMHFRFYSLLNIDIQYLN